MDGKVIRGLDIKERVGRGRYGTVYRVVSRQWGCDFCLKIISNAEADPLTRYLFTQEAETLRLVCHINVVRLYDYFEEDGNFLIVLEYCPNGSLQSMIDSTGPLSMVSIRVLFKQIFDATKYFHSIRICHRDLKPANIACDRLGRPKILDWGYSTVVQEGQLLDTYCGSFPYTPPECVKREPYDGRKADMWSLGVTLYVCAFGRDPWRQSRDRLLAGELTFDEGANPQLCDLVTRLVRVNPDERLSAEEALSHPFFVDLKSVGPAHSGIAFKTPFASRWSLRRKAVTAKRILCMPTF